MAAGSVLVLAGCEQTEAPTLPEGTRVAFDAASAQSLTGPARMALGTSADTLTLDVVSGALFLDSGWVAVADRGGHRILIADGTGAVRQVVGREGQGPIGFSVIAELRHWSGDSLFAYDAGLSRFSVIDPRSGAGRTFQVPGLTAPPFAAVPMPGGGLVLALGNRVANGDFQPGMHRLDAGLTLWNEQADSMHAIGAVPTHQIFVPDGGGFVIPPLPARTHLVAREGTLLVSDGANPWVDEFDPDGVSIGRLLVDGLSTSLEGDLHARVTDSLVALASSPVRMARTLASTGVPTHVNGVGWLSLGRDGRLWLGAPNVPGQPHRRWISVGPQAQDVRSYVLPRDADVLDSYAGIILLRRQDPLGVQSVEVWDDPER